MIGGLLGLGLMGAAVALADSPRGHERSGWLLVDDFKQVLAQLRADRRNKNCEHAMMALARAEQIIGKLNEQVLWSRSTELSNTVDALSSLLNKELVHLKHSVCRAGLHGLGGAVKVCLAYHAKKAGPKGKMRRQCAQWGTGPGYTHGPYPIVDYYIPEVRESAGIKRKYRYRKGLPYPPTDYGKVARIRSPELAVPGVVRIVELGPSAPYEEQVRARQRAAVEKAASKALPASTEPKKRSRKKKGG